MGVWRVFYLQLDKRFFWRVRGSGLKLLFSLQLLLSGFLDQSRKEKCNIITTSSFLKPQKYAFILEKILGWYYVWTCLYVLIKKTWKII